jgi:hypothetical protein
MQIPLSAGTSFLVFRIFIAFFLSVLGLAIALHGSEFAGAVLAAIGLTFLTIMWLIVRSVPER